MKFIRQFADLLDTKFNGPFGWKIGLDGLIGLIPVFGDAVTSIMSLIIIVKATQYNVSISVILRMLLNVLIDNIISKIPFIGFILDFTFKSNQRNLKLIEDFQKTPQKTKVRSLGFITLISCAGLAFIVAVLIFSWKLTEFLWTKIAL